MAENYTHFLGGSYLNRLGWLRSSPQFLTTALQSPKTKWVVFNDSQPLITITSPRDPSPGASSKRPTRAITQLPTSALIHLLGPAPYFSQGEKPGDTLSTELTADEHGTGKFLITARIHGPPIVFLGVRESETDALLPSSEFKNPQSTDDIHGEPYFALDVANISQADLASTFLTPGPNTPANEKSEFSEPRSGSTGFSQFDASIFSIAKTMGDWNSRNKFCASCGSKTYSLWAGWKLSCSSHLPWTNNEGREPCPTAKGLHNHMHPRTDVVVITAVLDETGNRMLLGRGKKFPAGFYSTLAGFLEPSESLEDAVVREIWEESGIRVKNVRYHSCQPWPYPASLMIGCFAFAESSQEIRTDLDNELDDARWVTREQVLEVFANPSGTTLKDSELKKFDNVDYSNDATTKHVGDNKEDKFSFRVPPKTAIAGVLISQWAKGELDGTAFVNLKAKI